MKVVSIVYLPELEDIGLEIREYFNKKEYIVFDLKLSIGNFEKTLVNFESSLIVSTLIIPILYPVQRSNKVYDDQRIFFEIAGNIEREQGIITLPIYLSSKDSEIFDLDKEQIRNPKQFFTNVFSLSWNSFIEPKNNIEVLSSQLKVISEFGVQTTDKNKAQVNNGDSIDEILDKIRKDDIPEALNLLKKHINGGNNQVFSESELIVLENQYNSLLKKDRNGIVKNEDLIFEKSRFTKRFIDSLMELRKNGL